MIAQKVKIKLSWPLTPFFRDFSDSGMKSQVVTRYDDRQNVTKFRKILLPVLPNYPNQPDLYHQNLS